MSSNSNRIEAATRQHVGATLTSAQITELVRLSDPSWKGGVYPSAAPTFEPTKVWSHAARLLTETASWNMSVKTTSRCSRQSRLSVGRLRSQ
jgi:hypothetical protein